MSSLHDLCYQPNSVFGCTAAFSENWSRSDSLVSEKRHAAVNGDQLNARGLVTADDGSYGGALQARLRGRKIVMLGPALNSMGGMASVARAYRDAGLFAQCHVLYLSTFESGAKSHKLRVAANALLEFLVLLAKRKIGLVHIHVASDASFWRKLVFMTICMALRIKYVFHLHGGDAPRFYNSTCGRLAKAIYRSALRRAAAVVALGTSWRDWVVGIVPGANVWVIPNPALGNSFENLERKPNELLFLGRLSRSKGVYDLIHALEDVREAFPEVRLILCGDGEIDQVRDLLKVRGLEGHVEVLGWVDGNMKESVLSEATVFVLPSYREGLPMSVLEAMAAGLPIVTTNVGAISDAITDGKEGFIVEPGNVELLATRLRELLANRSLQARMGAAGVLKVRTMFAVEVVVRKVEQLYCDIIGHST